MSESDTDTTAAAPDREEDERTALYAVIHLRTGAVIEFRCSEISVQRNAFKALIGISWKGGEGPLYLDVAEVVAVTTRREPLEGMSEAT